MRIIIILSLEGGEAMAALARAPLNLSVGRFLIALCLCSLHANTGSGEELNSSSAGECNNNNNNNHGALEGSGGLIYCSPSLT